MIAQFIGPVKLDLVETLLEINDIEYQTWYDVIDEKELRIDLSLLSENELEILQEEFEDFSTDFDYVIFWR